MIRPGCGCVRMAQQPSADEQRGPLSAAQGHPGTPDQPQRALPGGQRHHGQPGSYPRNAPHRWAKTTPQQVHLIRKGIFCLKIVQIFSETVTFHPQHQQRQCWIDWGWSEFTHWTMHKTNSDQFQQMTKYSSMPSNWGLIARSQWVIPVGYPVQLSRWVILVGYPGGLSRWVIPVGYPGGLFRWVNPVGYTGGLFRWVISVIGALINCLSLNKLLITAIKNSAIW